MTRRRLVLCLLSVCVTCLPVGPDDAGEASPSPRIEQRPGGSASPRPEADLSAARALFERNLDAIRRHDRDGYLACYLDTDALVRTGADGIKLGFRSLDSETTVEDWPDHFDASDLRLVSVCEGVTYGTYRYRVRFKDAEQSGLSERLFVRTPGGWRIAVTTAFPSPPGTPPPPKALVGATLVDGNGGPPVRDSVVFLREGKIECAGSRQKCTVPAGVETLDVSGLWITPGVVDAHVHYSQTGWADGRPDSLDLRETHPYEQTEKRLRSHPERFFRADLCSGVTAVFDVGGYPWTLDLQERSRTDSAAPRFAAAGPLLSTTDFWLNLPGERQFIFLADEKAARDGVRYLSTRGAAAAKVWFIVRNGEGARDFEEMARVVAAAGEEARRAGLPLIVHATGLREAKAALRAGAKLLVHSVWDVAVDEEFLRLAKDGGTVYCPTLTVPDGYRRMYRSALSGEPPAVDDPNGCVDRETLDLVRNTPAEAAGHFDREKLSARVIPKEIDATASANLKKVFDAGITIAMGTDAGNPLTLHGPSVYAEMEAMQAAGLSPMDVLVASTRGGALAMGRMGEFGTIEAGKAADLLVVAADPASDISNLRRLRLVVRGGVARSVEELRRRP